MLTNLKEINTKKALTFSVIDQLESTLLDKIDNIIDIVEGKTIDDLVDEYGTIEASLITYAYSVLVMKICDGLIEKFNN